MLEIDSKRITKILISNIIYTISNSYKELNIKPSDAEFNVLVRISLESVLETLPNVKKANDT